MKSRLFTILSACSLLLFVAGVVMWVRSYDPGDFVIYYDSPRSVDFLSCDGLLRVSWGYLTSKEYPPKSGWDVSFWRPDGVHRTFSADLRTGTTMGFRYERWQRQTPDLQADARIVTVPYWALAALTSVLPLVAAMRWKRAIRARRGRRLAAQGMCARCGYDLRATPGRCPECGMTSGGSG